MDDAEKLISFAGVVALLLAALKWLNTAWKTSRKETKEAYAETATIRETRITELKDSAKLLATSGELVKESMKEVTDSMKDVRHQLETDATATNTSIAALTKSIDDLKRVLEAKPWDSSKG